MYYVSRPHDANISNVKCEGLLYDIIVQGIDIENTAGTTITPKQKNLFTSFTHAPSNKIVTFPTLINIDNYVHPVIDFINDNSPKPKIGKFTLEELQNHVLDQYGVGADTDVARKKLISKLFSKL
jgi:hypothetical protein